MSTEESIEDDAPRKPTMPKSKFAVLNVDQLVARLEAEAGEQELKNPDRGIVTIGLVGYPNVGKSSTINALIRRKKVSTSATPGKTKRYQTIHLTPTVVLCDCPGLVFPRLATTVGEMVCQGILPIDELRDVRSPVRYVLDRIPVPVLEKIYGFKVPITKNADGRIREPGMESILDSLASARGFMKGGGDGAPDQNRIARILLKDFVRGKLLYVAPPPTFDAKSAAFPQLYSHSSKFVDKIEAQTLAQETLSTTSQSSGKHGKANQDNERIRMMEMEMDLDKKLAMAAHQAGVPISSVASGGSNGVRVRGKVVSPFARPPGAVDVKKAGKKRKGRSRPI